MAPESARRARAGGWARDRPRTKDLGRPAREQQRPSSLGAAGPVLRFWRESSDLTQTALSAAAGLARNTVCRVERGAVPLRSAWARDLAAALELTPAERDLLLSLADDRPRAALAVVSPDEEAAVVALRGVGWTLERIAATLALGPSTVAAVLRRHGVAPPPADTAGQRAPALAAYRAGTPLREIIRTYRVSIGALYVWLEEAGIERRRARRPRPDLRKLTEEQESDFERRYRAGESAWSLAPQYGIAAANALKMLRRRGVPIRPYRPIPPQLRRAKS